jgi:hypothetical protein
MEDLPILKFITPWEKQSGNLPVLTWRQRVSLGILMAVGNFDEWKNTYRLEAAMMEISGMRSGYWYENTGLRHTGLGTTLANCYRMGYPVHMKKNYMNHFKAYSPVDLVRWKKELHERR